MILAMDKSRKYPNECSVNPAKDQQIFTVRQEFAMFNVN